MPAKVAGVSIENPGAKARARALIALALIAIFFASVGPLYAQASYTIRYSFTGPPSDGSTPYGGLLLASDGNLYGTTTAGGSVGTSGGSGTVFEVSKDSSGNYTVVTILFSFGGTSGCTGIVPRGNLIQASDGNIYGTTFEGGADDAGTVFEMSKDSNNNFTVCTQLYAFTGSTTDGYRPYAGLMQASDGNLYGTTSGGNASGQKSVAFELSKDSNGNFTVETGLHNFTATTTDGGAAYGGLIQGKDGNIYGTTSTGGSAGKGTAYELSKDSNSNFTVFTLLHSFTGFSSTGVNDGADPIAALVQASDGNFYGTTETGGVISSPGGGTVFELSPDSNGAFTVETLRFIFQNNTLVDGCEPEAPLIQASDGNLYGTVIACAGDSTGTDGTVFELSKDANGNFTVITILADLGRDTGGVPQGSLLQVGSLIYGTGSTGGAAPSPGFGVIFSVAPGGLPATPTTLTYNGPTTMMDGSSAELSATLTQTANGAPIANETITFTLGVSAAAQTCSATTDSAGVASCSIASVLQPVASTSLVSSFAGDSTFALSSATNTISITGIPTSISYSGAATLTDGSSATFTATITQPQSSLPINGLSISFTLGTGSGTQTCSGNSNSSGVATCTIADVTVSAGSSSVTAAFAGNTNYLASTTGAIAVTIASPTPTLVSIRITPPTPFVAIGATQQFTATGTFSDNSTQDITSTVAWVSSTPAVATVGSNTGLAIGVSIGPTQITATLGSIVSPPDLLTVSSSALVSIGLVPASTLIAFPGNIVPFFATGFFADGSARDITTSVTWASSIPAEATINPFTGVATAVAADSPASVITATAGSISSTSGIRVLSGTIESIVAGPTPVGVAEGTPMQLFAVGTYANGTVDVTGDSTWTSSNSSIAAVDATTGVVTGEMLGGPVTITAALGGFQATVSVTVLPAIPSWTPTGNLFHARALQSATLLSNGMVLIAGGEDVMQGGNPIANAELYNPTTGKFSATGSMTIPRAAHTATLLTDGTVLIAGGETVAAESVSTTNTAEIYDPASGTFSATRGSMTAATEDAAAVRLNNGMVLIAGGRSDTSANNTALATAELYNPATKTFTATGSLATARESETATLLSTGDVFVAGGSDSPGDANVFSSAELYNPTSGTFSAAGNMTSPRVDFVAVPLTSGKILLAGGFASGGGTAATSTFPPSEEIYDPVANTFTATAALELPRGSLGAVLLNDGTVLLTGGQSANMIPTATAEIYDPTAGTFAFTANMISPRVLFTVTLLPSGNVLAAGGLTFQNILGTAEIYSPLSTPPPTLVSISVTPASPSIAVGAQEQFTATGTFSDNSTQDITTSVTWASTNTGVATIGAATGLATGVSPGTTQISATQGSIVSPADTLTVAADATTLTYTGPTTFTDGSAGTLSATLTVTQGAAVSGASISFTLGAGTAAQTCAATTNSSGAASCTITSVNQTAGPSTVSAAFAGNSTDAGSSTGAIAVTITAVPPAATTLTYTGPTTFTDGSAGTPSATLKQSSNGAAISGASISFTLGSGTGAQTCTGTTNSSGSASCTITSVNQAAGSSTLSASFAGNSNFLASTTGPVSITISATVGATILTYTGPHQFTLGASATFSAVLTQTQNSNPVPGATISFTLKTSSTSGAGHFGRSPQTGQPLCTAATNSAGVASCSVADLDPSGVLALTLRGNATFQIVATFAGNSSFLPSSTASNAEFPFSKTSIDYLGAQTFTDGNRVRFLARPVDGGAPAFASATFTFTLGAGDIAQSCGGETKLSQGLLTCAIRDVLQPVGPDTLTISYSGFQESGHTWLPASLTVNVTILAGSSSKTILTYTGPTTVTNGQSATLSAVLQQAENGSGISGQVITFTLQASGFVSPSSATRQQCTGTTDATGAASCTIANVNQPAGKAIVTASFAGNATEHPSRVQTEVSIQ
jgi:trimeric autotransporter adhesin